MKPLWQRILNALGFEYGVPDRPRYVHPSLPYRRVAIIDGTGAETTIGLYWADKDGELVQEIEWPAVWPEWVSRKYAESKGFEIVRI